MAHHKRSLDLRAHLERPMPNEKSTTEIERKFLVDINLLPDEGKVGGTDIIQGYLSTTPLVRIRIATYPEHLMAVSDSAAWIAIKGSGLLTRKEFEYEVPMADAMAMLGMCSKVIKKTRRLIKVGKHTWEVDEFKGVLKGFWMGEVELMSEDEEFEMPVWALREVTMDPTYTNSALADSLGVF